ncbi:hypothetical protein Tco_1129422 [Tanacetum coccineum]
MASEHSSSGPALHEMTPVIISSGLVVDLPAPEDIAPIDEVVAPVPAVSTGLHSSTIVDQDAPSPSNSQTTPETQPPVIPNDVEEDNHDIEIAHMGNDLYFGIPIPEIPSDQSSSSDSIHTIVHPNHQISEHNSKWTEDHPLENIIGELDRPVSTRLQLHKQAIFYYYNAFLPAVEPRTYKDALTQSCWIEAICKIRGYKDLSCICRSHEHGRLPNHVYPDNPNHVYKLKKALYGLKQAQSRVQAKESSLWVETSSTCVIFQNPRGVFINQSKYALESLKKYGFDSCNPVDTPMVEKSKLDEDKEGKVVDTSHYHGMIGTLLYLITSRPDLQFAICMCARYQAWPTEKHLHAVKRIFRYLRGTVNRGL